MAPEGNDHEVSGNGSVATNRGVSSGKEGLSAGRDIIQPQGVDWTPIAIVAIVVVALVVVFVAAIVFWSGKFRESIPSSTPKDTPTSTAAYTPVPTEMLTTVPTHTPTLTSTHTPMPTNTPTSISTSTVTPAFTPTNTFAPTPDSSLPDALHLIGVVTRFICNELEGRRQQVMAEEMWCQKGAMEELCKYIEQQGEQRGVFFTYHESPVMGQDNCLWLWSKYVKGMEMEEVNGYPVCAVERWAYLPEETEKQVIAFVSVSMCHLDVEDEQLCIRVCRSLPIWYNDHITRNQWDNIGKDWFWPTPVPPTR